MRLQTHDEVSQFAEFGTWSA